uniref:Plectin-like n=1 Tax=Phallusia mammillata TaxID=59560 RepID=A0A6F9DPM9_9ASCI|nr:plectin-like [Phallusia mammillata]
MSKVWLKGDRTQDRREWRLRLHAAMLDTLSLGPVTGRLHHNIRDVVARRLVSLVDATIEQNLKWLTQRSRNEAREKTRLQRDLRQLTLKHERTLTKLNNLQRKLNAQYKKGPRNKSEIPSGTYGPNNEPKDKDSCVIESETQTDAESQTDLVPEKQEEPSPEVKSPPSECDTEPDSSSSSEEESSEDESSDEEEEEDTKSEQDIRDSSSEPEEVEEEPVTEVVVEKVEVEPQMEAPPVLSRRSSLSESSSSSSDSEKEDNPEIKVEENVVLEDQPEEAEKEPVAVNEPQDVVEEISPPISIERNPSQASRVPSIDVGGGITLSLRIERGSEAAPKVTVNGRALDRGNDCAVSSSDESDEQLRRIASQRSDGIEVIRRYETPSKYDDVFDVANRKKSDNLNSALFRPSSLPSDDGSDEMAISEDAVAGVINVTSGEKLTICQAMNKGLIPKKTALLLLEAQAATGCVVNPRNGVKFSVQGAIDLGIIDEHYKQTLVAAEGAYYGYLDPRTTETVCLSQAMNRGIFPKAQGMRLLEAQVATGGVIDPWTGARFSLDVAQEKGLVDAETAHALRTPAELMDFFDPTTRMKLNYADLLSKCIRDLDTGLKFLYIEEKPRVTDLRYQPDLLTFRSAFRKKVTLQELIDAGLVEDPILDAFRAGKINKEELRDILQPFLVGEDAIAGVLNKTNHQVMTISQAVKSGLLRRGTALELLEAQAATGSIIDPFTGKKMSVDRAVSAGIVDKEYASALHNAEQAVHGFLEPGTKRLISLFEAMKKGMVIEIHGIRMLEAQLATGGLIDPEAGYRIPTTVALERGLFDYRMADILTTSNTDLKGYYNPNTGENNTYAELMKRCVKKKRKRGNMLLLPVKDQAPMAAAMHKGAYRHRKVMVTDPLTNRHLSVDQAVSANVIDRDTANELSKSEGVWSERSYT